MSANEIGLVAVVDASRLSRNIVDLLRFIQYAQPNRVLLAQGDQVIDFNDPTSTFVGGILSLNAIRENQARIHLSVQARWKKARAGTAPTGPPVGYVRLPDGSWTKDPDPQVREVIRLIFDKFLELGSLRKVVRYLRANAIQVPRRRRRNRPLWTDATYTAITSLLKNPVYAGQYIFGQPNRSHRQRVPGNGLASYRSRRTSGSPYNNTTNLMWILGGGAALKSEFPETVSYCPPLQGAERRFSRASCAARFTTGFSHSVQRPALQPRWGPSPALSTLPLPTAT